ncbi:unnamed protein product [Darwinula stevensoni]|uniref:Uncharacterized protein n=1 Tax=Darwinula stevensoni TaxID=69355 RepID=A0A7R9A3P2_9CRUS|nr:unnamed protein product [Darwinula stevensoni]CAG0881739.1 unnamed protein product [Darwinula stevensoni]
MASMKDTKTFFEKGTPAQFEYVLSIYDDALRLKAEQKKKPEELLKLDKWYQEELPKNLRQRDKDKHLTHDELVQCMKWKLARGKFRPRLKELVQMNTPRHVQSESKKAFRALLKKDDVSSAIQALCNLKGVGPAMASAILAAGCPERIPFMADECLLSVPGSEGIDYTLKEYLTFLEQISEVVKRLNRQSGHTEGKASWTAHKVELALWCHYTASELKASLLDKLPCGDEVPSSPATKTHSENGESQQEMNGPNGNEEDDQSRDSGLSDSNHPPSSTKQSPSPGYAENSNSNFSDLPHDEGIAPARQASASVSISDDEPPSKVPKVDQ